MKRCFLFDFVLTAFRRLVSDKLTVHSLMASKVRFWAAIRESPHSDVAATAGNEFRSRSIKRQTNNTGGMTREYFHSLEARGFKQVNRCSSAAIDTEVKRRTSCKKSRIDPRCSLPVLKY